MVVAIKQEPAPLDDLIIRGVEWMKAGLPASAAADEVRQSVLPDDAAYEACFRRGLTEFIQAAAYLNSSKADTPLARRVREAFGASPVATQPARPSRVSFLFLDKPLMAADGSTKLLRAFTTIDLDYYGRASRSRGEALIRTADLVEKAKAMLEEHGVDEVGDLPESALVELDQGDWT